MSIVTNLRKDVNNQMWFIISGCALSWGVFGSFVFHSYNRDRHDRNLSFNAVSSLIGIIAIGIYLVFPIGPNSKAAGAIAVLTAIPNSLILGNILLEKRFLLRKYSGLRKRSRMIYFGLMPKGR